MAQQRELEHNADVVLVVVGVLKKQVKDYVAHDEEDDDDGSNANYAHERTLACTNGLC